MIKDEKLIKQKGFGETMSKAMEFGDVIMSDNKENKIVLGNDN